MELLSISLLILSILLSSGRNLLSKSISSHAFGQKSFFLLQGIIFFCGAIILFIIDPRALFSVSSITIIYSLIYALLLLSAQWCYTAALKSGQVSICATVYSLGFILPTLCGMILWNESLSVTKIIGIILVIPTIIFSSMRSSENTKKSRELNFIFPLAIAMLSSGGLGIMQKLQQRSQAASEREAFVLIAFLISASVSFICGAVCKSNNEKLSPQKLVCASFAGICFGACNLLNTLLAGLLDGTVLFPSLNIGSILVSVLLSITIFEEHITKKHVLILLLGISSILLIALSK